MSSIDINILGIASVIPKVKQLRINKINDSKGKIENLRCRLDTRVLEYKDLNNRLRKIINSIDDVEENMYVLEKILNLAYENYYSAEDKLVTESRNTNSFYVSNGSYSRMRSPSKNENLF